MSDRTPSQSGPPRRAVWPYFFLSAAAGLAGLAFVVLWWPADYPHESDLVKVSGDIATVVVRDDISDTSAGAAMAVLTSVYFTLKGVEGEFRYPSSHPDYVVVRDYTGYAIDVWVERDEIGSGRPMIIWAIQEHSPYNNMVPETSIGYDAIASRLTAIDRSMVEAGFWLLFVSIVFGLTGVTVQRRNRGRPPPMPA